MAYSDAFCPSDEQQGTCSNVGYALELEHLLKSERRADECGVGL